MIYFKHFYNWYSVTMVLMEKALRRKGLFCECFVRGRSGRVDEAFSGEQTK